MAMQDPFAADEAYTRSVSPQATARVPAGSVRARSDGTAYAVLSSEGTSETPTQLLNQGYRQEADGTWVRYAEPAEVQQLAQSGADPFAADVQNAARDTAQNAVMAANPLGSQLAFQTAALEQAPLGDEAAALFGTLFTGKSYSEMRDLQAQQAEFDRQNYGGQRNLGGAAGFTAGLTVPVGSGYVQGARGLAQVGRGAALGAGTGAVYGFGAGDGSAVERLPGAVQGATVGGLTGGALTGGTQYASRLLGISNAGTRPANINRAEGRAAQRLVASIEDRPAAVQEYQRLNALGLQPSVMDVGGGTTERLVRTAAGPAGPAANAAVLNAGQRAANLKPEVLAVTRGLSDDPRSAASYLEGLERTRGSLADEMYPEAYATPVRVTDELMSALGDEPGRAALRRARAAAVARRNDQQVEEIDALLNRSQQSVPTPGPRADLELSGSLAIPDAPTPQQMGQFGRVERVPLSAARRTNRLEQGRSPGELIPGYGDRPVAVRKENGEYLIFDGNNRANAAYRNGQDDLEMYVIDARNYAPEMAGRPSSLSPQSDDALLAELRGEFGTNGFEVSAGTLDRARIAMAGRGQKMMQSPDTRDIGSGLFDRASGIDQALEGVPELGPARATYRNLTGAMEAVDNAPQVFSTDPRDFTAMVQNMSPEQRQAMVVGLRQNISDTLGSQRQAGVGAIQRLYESPYVRQNLTSLLGEAEATQYLSSLQARVEQLQRAARVSPNTNSQTFGRAADEAAFSAANAMSAVVDTAQSLRGDVNAGGRTVDRIASWLARAGMSQEERNAIVNMGIGSADELERIVALAADFRRQGRTRLPREVINYINRIETTVGGQTAARFEAALLNSPSQVLAEQEQQ